jgi:predicted component of type VI protein secretion system
VNPSQTRLNCPYKEDAIKILIKADPELNTHDNVPHTLHLCFYQLKDPNPFNLRASYDEGLYELLDCKPFDPSVTSFEPFEIQPKQKTSEILDRSEGSNFIGIAAGYYTFEKERIIRFKEIPVETKRKWYKPWSKYNLCKDLNLRITLGPQQIDNVEVLK